MEIVLCPKIGFQGCTKRKLRVLNNGMQNGNVSKTCRYFGISRETFYKWKRTYENVGEKGLIHSPF